MCVKPLVPVVCYASVNEFCLVVRLIARVNES